ncbi:hypothetical protein V2A84_23195 [Yersinia sp. 2553 StPb PI]|uniref:hypothetical protein n=1 Tax=Yersinia sp. 2553 StPb PI TaxID=3117411 RepID=UPI003FA49F91
MGKGKQPQAMREAAGKVGRGKWFFWVWYLLSGIAFKNCDDVLISARQTGYQTQPDGYVHFDWRGKPMEGEFYRYESFGAEIDPKLGYVRPFGKAFRQQLVDNLQVTQR